MVAWRSASAGICCAEFVAFRPNSDRPAAPSKCLLLGDKRTPRGRTAKSHFDPCLPMAIKIAVTHKTLLGKVIQ